MRLALTAFQLPILKSYHLKPVKFPFCVSYTVNETASDTSDTLENIEEVTACDLKV